MNLVECKNLTKRYGNFVALENVNLSLERGKIIGLLGSNGSGKTTLIKLMNELLTPTAGEILVQGKKPGRESKKSISYLPEISYFDDNMKVKEVVNLFGDFYDNFNRQKAMTLLEKFQIDMKRRLKSLSKGNKEKVQLVLVMSREVDLYILDEPIGGVDPAAREVILDTILDNFNKDASIIISTHLIADIERILDEVVFISQGRIVRHESADEMRGKSGQSIDEIFREEFRC